MKYKVLIIVKDKWYSDQKEFASFVEAKRHQKNVAAKWSDCETCIARGSDVLSYREADLFLASLSAK
jgi:hypothetical protein